MVALCVLALAAAPGAARLPDPCAAPPALLSLGADLPRTRALLAGGGTLRILAIGSSSTQGHGASSRANTYPAVLARLLAERHPAATVEVVNAGIGGQTALHVRARLEAEVLRVRPELVLWQTGANDAMQGVDLAQFREAVVSGAAMLQRAGIELVLVPPQSAPAFDRAPAKDRFLETLQAIATTWGIPYFRRYELMRFAAASADPPRLVAPDGLHLNDLGYRCLATQLADALESAPPEHTTGRRPDR